MKEGGFEPVKEGDFEPVKKDGFLILRCCDLVAQGQRLAVFNMCLHLTLVFLKQSCYASQAGLELGIFLSLLWLESCFITFGWDAVFFPTH